MYVVVLQRWSGHGDGTRDFGDGKGFEWPRLFVAAGRNASFGVSPSVPKTLDDTTTWQARDKRSILSYKVHRRRPRHHHHHHQARVEAILMLLLCRRVVLVVVVVLGTTAAATTDTDYTVVVVRRQDAVGETRLPVASCLAERRPFRQAYTNSRRPDDDRRACHDNNTDYTLRRNGHVWKGWRRCVWCWNPYPRCSTKRLRVFCQTVCFSISFGCYAC